MKKIDLRENQITNRQMAIILVQTVVGIGFLSIGRALVTDVGPGAWISLILAGGLWGVAILTMSLLAQRFPGQLPVQYIEQILGRFLGKLIVFMYFFYLVFVLGMVLNEFLAVIKNFLLPTTPTPVILFSMLLVVVYMAQKQLKNIGRVFEHLFFVLIPTFLVLVPVLFQINKYNLYFALDIKKILMGTQRSFFALGGFEIFLFLYPLVTTPKQKTRTKAGLVSVSLVILTYLFVFFISVGYFGQEVMSELIWPTINLLRAVQFPFFGRVAVIFIVLWVNLVFTTVAGFYYILLFGIQLEFGLKDKRWLHLILIPLVYGLALYPRNLLETFRFSSYIGIFSAIFGLVIPLLLLVIAKVRKVGGSCS